MNSLLDLQGDILISEYVCGPLLVFNDEILCLLSSGDTISYIKGLLIGLDFLHSKLILHRDIKPANYLFCTRTKRGKICDYGLCCKINEMSIGVGTFGFRHPDIISSLMQNKPFNMEPGVDLWAAGIILYSLLIKKSRLYASSYVPKPRGSKEYYEFETEHCKKIRNNIGLLLCRYKWQLEKLQVSGDSNLQVVQFGSAGTVKLTWIVAAYDVAEKLVHFKSTSLTKWNGILSHSFFQN